ncbi:glycosyltransferase, partial [bacterium]|nr:glycosyltransferase [bacterium]
VAIFDCDHVPTRSYLQMMMGWFFRDPKIVMVQAPHHFYPNISFLIGIGAVMRSRTAA